MELTEYLLEKGSLSITKKKDGTHYIDMEKIIFDILKRLDNLEKKV